MNAYGKNIYIENRDEDLDTIYWGTFEEVKTITSLQNVQESRNDTYSWNVALFREPLSVSQSQSATRRYLRKVSATEAA